MKKTVLALLVAIAAVTVSAMVITHTLRSDTTPKVVTKSTPIVLPPAYSHLSVGMTQAQVLATLGPPMLRGTNRKFEKKTPAEWAKIQAQVDADAPSEQDLSAPTNLNMLKLNAELEHRVRYVWQYKASSDFYDVLSFDGDGNLMKWGVSPISKAPKRGGGAGHPA
jgi:hypothetical protein